MNLLDKIKKPKLFSGKKNRFFTYGLWATLLFEGIFGCGMSCGKKNPSSQNTQNKIEVKTQVTNSEGQANFIDNSTSEEVILGVVDKYDGSPIRDMEITYCDGEGYEVFLINDPFDKYLPSMGVYPHNSNHLIEIRKLDEGIYKIYTVHEDENLAKVIQKWETDYYERTWKYEETINYKERLEIENKKAVVVDFVVGKYCDYCGIPLPMKPSEIYQFLYPEGENPPQRWDVYTHKTKFILSTGNFPIVMIPSNIPTVSIEYLNINDDKVGVSWEGADKDTYNTKISSRQNDLTKYVDGNSTSDLVYSHRVVKNGNVVHSWTPYNSRTSATIDLPERGNYTLELRVKDEVDNVGGTSVDFPIKGGYQIVEAKNDDGTYESSYGWNEDLASRSWRICFWRFINTSLTPPKYPFQITKLQMNIKRKPAEEDRGFGIYIYNGDQGLVVENLFTTYGEINSSGWWEKDFSDYDLIINSGTIKIEILEKEDYPQCSPPLYNFLDIFMDLDHKGNSSVDKNLLYTGRHGMEFKGEDIELPGELAIRVEGFYPQ